MNEPFSSAELSTGVRLNLEPALVRRVLDTYLEECKRVAQDRRAVRLFIKEGLSDEDS